MGEIIYRNYNNKGIFIFLTLVIQPFFSKAQTHQDCFDAITVCTNTYVQTNASAGFGSIQEVSAGASCLGNGETNSTWYLFYIQNPGTILFQIAPLNSQDDYDFVLYKFNGDCSDIVNGITPVLRCNYSSALGSTGLSQGFTGINVSSNGANQCAPLSVLQNEKYVLMINNFTATNSGYTLNFSGSASIYDTDPPLLTSTNITSCGPSLAYVFFTESIKCSTIAADGSDFKITGPSGVTITSAGPLSAGNIVLTPGIKVYFSGSIVVPGNYTLHIKKGSDGNTLSDYCDNMTPEDSKIHFNILYSSPVATVISVTNANCNNNDGTATATVNGGTPPYSYSWNSLPIQNTLTATGLAPGQYTFAVTDANGCTSHAIANISVTGLPSLTVTTQPETCDSLNNGSATVTIQGGIAPYSYSWNTNPVQTTPTATGLSAGTYTVIVTGANGCTASITAQVPLVGMPDITMSHTNISCDGSLQGSATANVSGHAPFTYLWSDGQTGTSISGLIPGSYTLTVTDASGCISTATVSIETGGMQLTVSTVNLVCGNIHNGSATVSAGQGIPPFTYVWNTNPQQISSSAINLPAGNWTVVVTDSKGCTDSITAVITGPPPIVANITTISAGCTLNDGSATATITGGHAPYTYLWNTLPVQHTPIASNLFAGAYQLTVTDSDNCFVIATAFINNWDGPHGFISDVIDATCNQPNGSASVTNVNGNGPFSFLWYTTPLQYVPTSTGLSAGTYTVKITDSEGCLSFLNVKINASDAPDLILDHVTNAGCGKEDGSASVINSSGSAPFSYEWFTNPHQFSHTATGLGASVYLAVVTDAAGCKDSLYVTVPENKAHNDFTFTTSCFNETAFFEGVTDYPGSVAWQWNFGDEATGQENTIQQQNSSHIFSSPGNYVITLYINGGCATDTLTKFLKESVKPDASFTFYPEKQSATSPVSFTYSGTPATNWLWNFGDGNISYDTDPVHTYKTRNTYQVLLYITDEFGCRDTAKASLDIDEPPAVFVPGGFTPNDDGINDNFIIPSFDMSSCDIKIFDRWGNMIFHSADPVLMNTQGWNGNVNGSKAQQGAYAYTLTGKLENGKPIIKEGFINLLR